MKKVISTGMLIALISIFALSVSANEAPDVPQPYAGSVTVAAPELLEKPEHSATKTIQDGEISETTQKLIGMGVIPKKADQRTQKSKTSN